MSDEPEAVRTDLTEFPEEIQEDVNGLVWLGHLEDEFELFGHHFVIRTLKGDEELAAGTLTKDHQDTMTQVKAWAWANVSLSLVSVDHDPDFCPPIGPDKVVHARTRFNYCTSKWYWFLADEIFKRLLMLNARQQAAANAIRDLSMRSPAAFSPSLGSLTDQGDSESPEPEILQHLDED